MICNKVQKDELQICPWMGPKMGTMSMLRIQFSSRVLTSTKKNLASITMRKVRWAGRDEGRKGENTDKQNPEGGRDFTQMGSRRNISGLERRGEEERRAVLMRQRTAGTLGLCTKHRCKRVFWNLPFSSEQTPGKAHALPTQQRFHTQCELLPPH